ncbi:MAG: hypothetical protein EA369_00095 [Bradymonadales bacterium]|nr:MAG: hypothetical protein EA369_00095 [Bradymonadales bacterium]
MHDSPEVYSQVRVSEASSVGSDAARGLERLLGASDQELQEIAKTTGISIEALRAAQADLKGRVSKGTAINALELDNLCLDGICGVPASKQAEENPYEAIGTLGLLTANFYTREQVLEDSKTRFPQKRFALIVIKSHTCDRTSGHCLQATQSLLDPYNSFVRDNFVLYHARALRDNTLLSEEDERIARAEGTYNIGDGMTGTPGIAQIIGEWPVDGMDRQLKVLDVSTGQIIGEVGIDSSLGRLERLKKLRNDLEKIPVIRETIGNQTHPIDTLEPDACLEPECSIEFVAAALEDQYQRRVAKSAPEIRRDIVERATRLINQLKSPVTPPFCEDSSDTEDSCCGQ